MGLFSKKKKTYINTSFSRLIEDRDIPELSATALYDYIYANNGNRNNYLDTDKSYSTFLVKANTNSIANKMRSARSWALNNYAYGVPEADSYDAINQEVEGKLEGYLKSIEADAESIEMLYGLFMPANALHITWQKLIDHHGYLMTDNILATLSQSIGKTVYLENIVIHYCSYTYENLADPETVMQYGLAATSGYTPWRTKDVKAKHTPFINDPEALHDFARITYTYDNNGVRTTGTFDLDFLDYEWSGLEPDNGLDESDADRLDPNAIAPIVSDDDDEKDFIIGQYYVHYPDGTYDLKVFTYEYRSYTNNALENLFNPTRLLGKFYPNIYLRLYGTNLASEPHHDTNEYKTSKRLCNRLGMKYKSLSDQIHEAVGALEDVSQILVSTQLPANTEDPLIQEYLFEYFFALYNQMPDAVADTSYASLNKEYINGYSKPGMAIDIGDAAYSSQVSFKSIGYKDKVGSIGPKGTVESSFGKEFIYTRKTGLAGLLSSYVTCHIYRKQLTANSYREITVYGLTSAQRVTGGKSTVATGQDSNLHIPIDDTIVVKFAPKDKIKLISKSLVAIINTLKVVKQKWYETTIFKVIMFIIAVVVSVFTGGQGMTLYAVFYAAVQAIAIGIVLSIAIKFLVKTLDIDLGVVFAVIAVVLIIMGAGASLSNSGSIMGMTSAQFLQAANYSVQISAASNQLELSKMIDSHNQLSMDMETKMKELAELEQEMDPDKYLSPYYLMSDSIRLPDIRVGEIMNDFLTRTLSVDSGLAPLSLIPNMVNLTVALPTFQQTYRKMMQQRSLSYEL